MSLLHKDLIASFLKMKGSGFCKAFETLLIQSYLVTFILWNFFILSFGTEER